MKSHNCSAKSSKEIKDTFYSLFGKKLSKEEFNSIAWGPLKQKFNHCSSYMDISVEKRSS